MTTRFEKQPKRRFAQAVAMIVPTFEDWGKLWLQMKDLGYECQEVSDRNFPWVAFTDLEEDRDVFAYIGIDHSPWLQDVYEIDRFNTDLFVAISAMSAGEEFYPGEWVCYEAQPGVMAKFIETTSESQMNVINTEGDQEWQWIDGWRKAKLSEIASHFTKPVIDKKETLAWRPVNGEKIGVADGSITGIFIGMNESLFVIREEDEDNDEPCYTSWSKARPLKS